MDDSGQQIVNVSEQEPVVPKLILVVGGSGSGKSALAEKLAVRLSCAEPLPLPLYYVATLQMGSDPENLLRVRKHQLQRQGAGFITREIPLHLGAAQAQGLLPEQPAVVLLECLSNLLANEMFLPSGVGPDQAPSRIAADLQALFTKVRHVVIVSNDIFADAAIYEETTGKYLAALGKLNQMIAARADSVVEAVCGLPLIHKDLQGKIGDWLCCG